MTIEIWLADFWRMINFPTWLVLSAPLGAALLFHLLRVRSGNPRLVKDGPWQGMVDKGDDRMGPTLLFYALAAAITWMLAAWLGITPRLP